MTDRAEPHVLCIGECMVEFAQRADGAWRRGFAGDTLNVAWGLRALLPPDVAVDYLTRIGVDDVSGAMLDFLAQAGLGVGWTQRDAERSVGLYMISTDAHGERSFSYWRDSAAARRLADDVETLARAMRGARLIYLSGVTAAILEDAGRETLLDALETARAAGARIAYDPNYRARLWRSADAMRDYAPRISRLCDILLPTHDDEIAAFGDGAPAETADRLAAWGCSEIVVKNGPAATLIDVMGERAELPVPNPVRPVDTTGAGDSFNAGYLAARLTGAAPHEAVRQGQRVAARVIMERGALASPQELRRAAGLAAL